MPGARREQSGPRPDLYSRRLAEDERSTPPGACRGGGRSPGAARASSPATAATRHLGAGLAGAAGPVARDPAVACPRRRRVRAPDVGLHHPLRAPQRHAGRVGSARPRRVPDNSGSRHGMRGDPHHKVAAGARAPRHRAPARHGPVGRALVLVLRPARDDRLHPPPPPKPLRALCSADGGGVRPGRGRLLAGADRPAVVGGAPAAASPCTAHHHGGRRAVLGSRLGAALRFSERQSARRNAVTSLRDLSHGRARTV